MYVCRKAGARDRLAAFFASKREQRLKRSTTAYLARAYQRQAAEMERFAEKELQYVKFYHAVRWLTYGLHHLQPPAVRAPVLPKRHDHDHDHGHDHDHDHGEIVFSIGCVANILLCPGNLISPRCFQSRRSWGYRGANSPIKGHEDFGLGPIRRHLRQHQRVLISHEWRSTKLCCCCLTPVRYMRRRVHDGFKNVNGAVQCANPRCALYGRTLSRDHNAGTSIHRIRHCTDVLMTTFFFDLRFLPATNIGYITLGQLLCRPLPCFTRSGNTALGALRPTTDHIAASAPADGTDLRKQIWCVQAICLGRSSLIVCLPFFSFFRGHTSVCLHCCHHNGRFWNLLCTCLFRPCARF